MKFAKRLEAEAVAEWRPKYLQYKQLKKLIKIVSAQRQAELLAAGLGHPLDLEKQSHAPLSPDELLFFERFEAEVRKIDDFYRMREQEAIHRKFRIIAQLQALPVEPEKHKTRDKKETRETREKRETRERRGRLSPSGESVEHAEYAEHAEHIERFGTFCSATSPDLAADHASILSHTQWSVNSNNVLETTHHLKMSSLRGLSTTLLAKKRIKKALLEYYRSLELLRNFMTLNVLGCSKILKKFDKNAGRCLEAKYFATVRERAFYKSATIDGLMTDVENIYRWVFTDGDRSKALRKLRVKNLKIKTYHREALWSGLSLGICLAIIYHMFWFAQRASMATKVLGLVYFYLGLPLVLAWLFAINAEVWEKYGISYRFIFELNQRNNLHVCQYSALVGTLCTCYLLLAAVSLSGVLDRLIRPLHQPWMVLIILCGIILWPFNHLYRQSRTWFARVVVRIVTAPFYPCRFKDFFINDQCMSLVPTFEALGILLYYTINTSFTVSWSPPAVWYVYGLQLLPGVWRSLQCLRRFSDSKMAFPHLVNLAKYCAFLVVICLFAAYKLSGSTLHSLFWLGFSSRCISSLLSLGWDILMDFGLWQRSAANDRLRDTILFPPGIYWYLMVSDVLARFVWIVGVFNILPSAFPSVLFPPMLATIEALRRFQWNFFRVEYEHVNNCNVFRAVADVPLPFAATDLFYQDMVETLQRERDSIPNAAIAESPRPHSESSNPNSPCTSAEEDLDEEEYEGSLDGYPQDLETVKKTAATADSLCRVPSAAQIFDVGTPRAGD